MTSQDKYTNLVTPVVYTWFFNKSVDSKSAFNVNLKSNISLFNVFENKNETNISLLPGEAKPYKVVNNGVNKMPDQSIKNEVRQNEMGEITVGSTIDISNVKFTNRYIKRFMGYSIRIKPGDDPNIAGIDNCGKTKISDSIVRLKAYTDCNEIVNTSSSSNAPRSKEVSELTYLQKTDLMIYPNSVNQG